MLKSYFKRERTRAIYSEGPAGPYLDAFTHWLEKQGYRHDTIRHRLQGAAQFAIWAKSAGLDVQMLTSTALIDFHDYLASRHQLYFPCGVHSARYIGAQHFLSFVQTTGIASSEAVAPCNALPALLLEFEHWMRTQRGVTETTLKNYCPVIKLLLTECGETPVQYNAKQLRTFVLKHTRNSGLKKAKNLVTATRMFLRFLIAMGRCAPGLDDAIPCVAERRLATLPRYLPPESIECIIANLNTATARGVRDKAIVLLLARLGLRASEIAGLKFDDIDWQHATISVTGKSRREARLPLPQEVGDALLDYLDSTRPPIGNAHIFISIVAPWLPISRRVVHAAGTRAILQAGVETPALGAHVYRHSAATAMLRQGASLPIVGEILRHTSIETTAQYAKVDVDRLQQITVPWHGAAL